MTTKCERCGRGVLNPIEHEFCVIKKLAKPKVAGAIPDDYVAPTVQGPIKHQMAKPGAKPKTSSLYYDKPSKHMFKRSNAVRRAIYHNFGKFNP